MGHEDIRQRGFKERTRLEDARARLAERVHAHGRTETLALADADGRVVARRITANRDVPHYDRAAMDGYAVRAADTVGASDRMPTQLEIAERVGPGRAVRVHTGSELPAGADAVIMIEDVDRRDGVLDVFVAVAIGENVGDAGEDVDSGATLYEPGARLTPSDVGLLKATGSHSVTVVERPSVAVIPTGDELVQRDPAPGEIIETNGLTVSQLTGRWGADPANRDIVVDDRDALRAAFERDQDRDLIVTTGGSSVGSRDLVPELVDEMGEVFVHGVALKPGHPVALGSIESTPVLMLPGYPVACIVNAVQFLRPAIAWSMGIEPTAHPKVTARLDRKLRSEPGQRTFARVMLDTGGEDPVAIPTRASGAGVLSSVTRADGWISVDESLEGIPRGELVEVEYWEWSP